MTVRIVSQDLIPNQKVRGSVCHDFPEWKETLEALSKAGNGEAVEIQLSVHSIQQLNVKDVGAAHSYFGKALRTHFKNFRMPAVAWSKNNRTYVKRTK